MLGSTPHRRRPRLRSLSLLLHAPRRAATLGCTEGKYAVRLHALRVRIALVLCRLAYRSLRAPLLSLIHTICWRTRVSTELLLSSVSTVSLQTHCRIPYDCGKHALESGGGMLRAW